MDRIAPNALHVGLVYAMQGSKGAENAFVWEERGVKTVTSLAQGIRLGQFARIMEFAANQVVNVCVTHLLRQGFLTVSRAKNAEVITIHSIATSLVPKVQERSAQGEVSATMEYVLIASLSLQILRMLFVAQVASHLEIPAQPVVLLENGA